MELRTLQHKKLEGFEFRSLNQPLQKKKSHEVHVISHHKSRENDTRYFRLSFTCNARCFHFHIGFVHFHGFLFLFFLHTRRFFLYYSFISMWVFSRVQEFFRRNSFIFLVLLLLVVFAHFRWNFIFSDVKFFVWSCDHIVHTMFSWVVQFQDVTCTLKCTFTCYFLFLLLTHLYVVKTYQYMWNVCDFSVKEPRELFNPQKLYYWII